MEEFITLNRENLDAEHICCAFSDKKCARGYGLKKEWLKNETEKGYVFRRLNARAKVFMEYGPAETGWVPVRAPGYLLINCFWVSGQYKQKGYGRELLRLAAEDARQRGCRGLVTVAGNRKFHFMSDGRWLGQQGFQICETLPSGFSLFSLKFRAEDPDPEFGSSVREGLPSEKGLTVYYSRRCPFTHYHVETSLRETAAARNLPLKTVLLETDEQARLAPSPATIFSLFYNGIFVTTDLSVCMDTRFDRIMNPFLS